MYNFATSTGISRILSLWSLICNIACLFGPIPFFRRHDVVLKNWCWLWRTETAGIMPAKFVLKQCPKRVDDDALLFWLIRFDFESTRMHCFKQFDIMFAFFPGSSSQRLSRWNEFEKWIWIRQTDSDLKLENAKMKNNRRRRFVYFFGTEQCSQGQSFSEKYTKMNAFSSGEV